MQRRTSQIPRWIRIVLVIIVMTLVILMLAWLFGSSTSHQGYTPAGLVVGEAQAAELPTVPVALQRKALVVRTEGFTPPPKAVRFPAYAAGSGIVCHTYRHGVAGYNRVNQKLYWETLVASGCYSSRTHRFIYHPPAIPDWEVTGAGSLYQWRVTDVEKTNELLPLGNNPYGMSQSRLVVHFADQWDLGVFSVQLATDQLVVEIDAYADGEPARIWNN